MKKSAIIWASEDFDDDDNDDVQVHPETRLVQLMGNITDRSAIDVVMGLRGIEGTGLGPIAFEIYSNGGSLRAGMIIHDVMKELYSPVCTIGYGVCASMAAMLLASGDPGHRYLSPSAKVMIHAPTACIQSDFSPESLEDTLNIFKQDYDIGLKLLSAYTGQRKSKIKSDLKKDKWMSAKEAIKYGLADKLLTHAGGMYAKTLVKPPLSSYLEEIEITGCEDSADEPAQQSPSTYSI
ncbi:MAG: ATP-dependent Clp protease proteolytic subunit [Candidatus Woesearchaeota archaeon]